MLVEFCTCAGYIQTPGWDGRSLHPEKMDSVVLVEVPPNHRVMLTILHLNLTGHRARCDTSNVTLRLYQDSISEDNMFWQCGQLENHEYTFKRKLLPLSTSVYLRFWCGNLQKTGFRLLFSVHEESATLTNVTDILWNCSVPYFNDFKLHFPCDMVPQCVGKEDEVDCPYTTDTCGLGFVTLGGRCLFYDTVTGFAAASWRKLDFLCGQRGGRLASLRSRKDFLRLMEYLESQVAVWNFFKLIIGLHTASNSLPHM